MNPVVVIRAKKLKLPVKHGVGDKIKELVKFSKAVNVDFEDIAYLGNDINDAVCMKKIGFPIAVADAVEDIKVISSFILKKKGGRGAVREFCELINDSKKNG